VRAQRWKYVILTGSTDELSLSNDKDLKALTSDDNRNGDVIKVVLASDKFSEGVDLCNVREVHIMNPWYHFQKIEQIIGRSSRTCSHAGLPPEKRNVTIYLHAALLSHHPDQESADTRAYRIAESKQRRIQAVEDVMVANSVDCSANEAVQFYDPSTLQLHMDIVGSNGFVIDNFPFGDRHPHRPIKCDANVQPGIAAAADLSTYDATLHAPHVELCKKAFVQMFTRITACTLDQVHTECRDRDASIALDSVVIAVQDVIDSGTTIQDRHGRMGIIKYALTNTYSNHSMQWTCGTP
jgi:hypothetical protein